VKFEKYIFKLKPCERMARMVRPGLTSIQIQEIRDWVKDKGLPSYRADQIIKWVYGNAETFDDMTNIPKAIRDSLEADFMLREVTTDRVLLSDDGTKKFVFTVSGGEKVEGVLMKYKYGSTVCISTQAGCRMGCKFCASPPAGYCRSLTAGEMLGQVTEAGKECGGRVDNVVLMGIGEPLDNFENVVTFLQNLSAPDGYQMSLRHVSLSTCGLADKIRELAEYKFGLTLSVSLHAPNDELRGKIMPINKKYGIVQLLSAVEYYTQMTGRRVVFEYALIRGVNDSVENARELAVLLRKKLCHINLIACNPVKGTGFFPPPAQTVQNFYKTLEQSGASVTIRRTMGADLDASCGQLRRNGQRES